MKKGIIVFLSAALLRLAACMETAPVSTPTTSRKVRKIRDALFVCRRIFSLTQDLLPARGVRGRVRGVFLPDYDFCAYFPFGDDFSYDSQERTYFGKKGNHALLQKTLPRILLLPQMLPALLELQIIPYL